jgi:hypothetical protein
LEEFTSMRVRHDSYSNAAIRPLNEQRPPSANRASA